MSSMTPAEADAVLTQLAVQEALKRTYSNQPDYPDIPLLKDLKPDFAVIIKSPSKKTFMYLMQEAMKYEAINIENNFANIWNTRERKRKYENTLCFYIPIIKFLGNDEYLFSVHKLEGNSVTELFFTGKRSHPSKYLISAFRLIIYYTSGYMDLMSTLAPPP